MQDRFNADRLLTYKRVSNRAPFHLSRDGILLALTAGRSVVVVDTKTGSAAHPFPEESVSWAPRWSPGGERLAAYIQHQGDACLGVWQRSSGECRLLRNAAVRVEYGFEIPQWTPDGGSLLIKAKSNRSEAKPPQVSNAETDLLSVKTQSYHPGEAEQFPDWTEREKGDLALIDVNTGEMRLLAENWVFRHWRIAPDGRAAATLRMADRDDLRGKNLCDLVVLSVDGSAVNTVSRGIGQNYCTGFSWSPDSSRIAYITWAGEKPGCVYVVPKDGSRKPLDITGDETPYLGGADPYVNLAPRWDPDGQKVYYMVKNRFWVLNADGSGQRSVAVRGRYWVQPPLEDSALFPDDRLVIVTALDQATKRSKVVACDISTGETSALAELDKATPDSSLNMEMARDGSACYLVVEAADQPPEVWAFQKEGGHRRVYSLNPELSRVLMGRPQLLDFVSADGRQARAALMLPPGYTGSERVPLIVVVYAGYDYSDDVNYFGFGPTHTVENAQFLAHRGYAVLYPDIPLEDRDPMGQMPGYVAPAVEHAIEMGIADPDRIGLYGHSYGGYTVLSLLVQTPLFKAAISHAPIANLTSFYGAGDWHWAENFQGRLGKPPWEAPEAYIRNSPLFYLDKASAPLLLVTGSEDQAATQQAEEVYNALRRLRKRVEWRLYRGESHHPGEWSQANLRDLCDAVLDWFDANLDVPWKDNFILSERAARRKRREKSH